MQAADLDLHALLAVDDAAGVLRFAGQRALIVDAYAMGSLRRELLAALGPELARDVLGRFAYTHGWRLAEALRERFVWDTPDAMRDAGGRVHMLQGLLQLAPGAAPMSQDGAVVAASYEAEQHLLHCGVAEHPVCWTLAGFASGYLSCVEGRDIVVLEHSCLGRGDPACRFHARPRGAADRVPYAARPTLPPAAAPLVAHSPAMRRVLELVDRVAAVDSTVLLLGETGTGKDRLARRIHARSPRAAAPFLAIHCGAIPEALLESELFGHARGAFTGAARDRVGLLEAAGHGTLLLDEIGEMSPAMQVKLLRALQSREIRRVGENHPRPVHARVLAATHRDLAAAVTAGSFRADLYYRLRVVEIVAPPLRARREDIVPLAEAAHVEAAARLRRPIGALAPEAAQRLLHHSWPGNVRELENAIERAVALAPGPRIELADLPADLVDAPASPAPTTPPQLERAAILAARPDAPASPAPTTLAQIERAAILAALARHGGQQHAAAAELGISASTLYRRLRQYQA